MSDFNSSASGRCICQRCLRVQKNCLCDLLTPVQAPIEIGIWQHPSEVKQVKGTARLAHLMLQRSEFWVGETLEQAQGEVDLADWLQQKKTFLLYPRTQMFASQLVMASPDLLEQETFQVLVLDATWRKTHKMLALNPVLQTLPRIELNEIVSSRYRIRKQREGASLSTIEAIYHLLQQLSSDSQPFEPLLNSFEQMQKRLEQYIPLQHRH